MFENMKLYPDGSQLSLAYKKTDNRGKQFPRQK